MTTTVHHGSPEAYERRWWALGFLCLSLLIVIVGNTSLNVVIPTLSRKLHASNSQLQWVVAIYSLVFAGLLFTTGAIGDRFGRKGALQAGLAVFFAGSFLASQSTTMSELIACRALMGAAAAFIMPSTLSILVNIFPPRERQKAIAVWASISGVGGSLGPVASGWLLGHFWFGSVFLVNLPIIMLAFVGGWFLVPKSKDPHQAKLDPPGAVLSSVGIAALVYGLIEAPDKGWANPSTLVWFAVAMVVLTLFVLWERRCDEPMLDMSFFRAPAYATGTGGMILLFMSMYGVMFMMTQYFQIVAGYSPLGASVRFLPMSPIMIVVGTQTPRITERFGANRSVAVGVVVLSTGMLTLLGLDVHSSYWVPFAAFCLLATGVALSMGPMTAAIMSAVPPRRAGAGSATNDATRELGGALGVAVLGSIAASRYATQVGSVFHSVSAGGRSAAIKSLEGALTTAASVGGSHGASLVAGAERAFVSGMHLATTIGGLLALSSAWLVWRFLPHSVSHAGAEHGHHEGDPTATARAVDIDTTAVGQPDDSVSGATAGE
jgi:EmrB/QacA subfamily drug resistance transporter